jgi:hypothetical protein
MYTFDKSGAEAARKSDTGGGTIKEIGKYVGEFTQAKDIVTKKGGKGIEFIFKTASGQKANLAIYTMSASGEKYQGYDQLMAIMACMGLRNIKPQLGRATRYDYDTKKDVIEECSIFPDLCKPIGVLLETEDYLKQDGSTGTRVVLKNVFQAGTELTASEILDRKTTPEQLEKMVAALHHRPIKGAKHVPSRQHGGPMPDDQFHGDDGDIPF